MKEYPETHKRGLISIEKDLKQGVLVGDLGIQIAKDGRVWICADGYALLRFKPALSAYEAFLPTRSVTMNSLILVMEKEDLKTAVEIIQDEIEGMDVLDKKYIIDMLQLVISYNRDLPEDLEDLKKRYLL